MSFSRANNFYGLSGQNGITPNTSTGFLTSVDGWTFQEHGGCLYPVGKNKTTLYSTGADQTWTVPAGVTYIFAKLWGAGGGPGRVGGWSYGAAGGGGGHTRGLIPVTPGTNLTVKVGVGGKAVVYGSSYGGGGGAGNNADLSYAGQGGGGTYIFNNTTPLLIAGGGGAGGSSRIWDGCVGGAGGGLTGQRGESPYDSKGNYAGTGGSQTAGGSSAGGSLTIGAQYQGGASSVNSYGGGGGGGYWGGGGGSYSETNTMGGGGGGSGYIIPTAKIASTYTGDYRYPAFFWDNDLDTTSQSNQTVTAHGSQNLQNNASGGTIYGGGGLVVIYY